MTKDKIIISFIIDSFLYILIFLLTNFMRINKWLIQNGSFLLYSISKVSVLFFVKIKIIFR